MSLIGTEDFIKENPGVIALCETAPEKSTRCNKDTGAGSRLQMWSRGHLFVVRPCGHIDQWQPLYRYVVYSIGFSILDIPVGHIIIILHHVNLFGENCSVSPKI